QVAEYHTYFVGSPDWGFSVWAHNAGKCDGSNEPNPELSAKRRAAAQSRWAKHRKARAAGERGTPAGRGPDHTARQREIVGAGGGEMEVEIVLTNGRVRIADAVDAQERIHQVGNMRTRGGLRPSGRERGAIEDIRKKFPDATIIFHDKMGKLPSLIN